MEKRYQPPLTAEIIKKDYQGPFVPIAREVYSSRENVAKLSRLREKENRTNDQYNLLDQALCEQLAHHYGISLDDVNAFLQQSLQISREVMGVINSFVDESKLEEAELEGVQFEEVNNTLSPTELFVYALFSNDVDLRMEAKREIIIRTVAFDVLVKMKQNKVIGINSKMQSLFTEHILRVAPSQEHRRRTQKVVSVHDNVTNETLRFELQENGNVHTPKHNPETEHLRDWNYLVRDFKTDSGRVVPVEYTQGGTKHIHSAVLKALDKSANDTEIAIDERADITRHLPDMMRAKIVVFNDDPQTYDEIRSTILSYIKNPDQKIGLPKVVDIIEKNTNGAKKGGYHDRGQSDMYSMKRYIIYFEGIEFPFELIFQTVPEDLNNDVQLDNNGDGQAHGAYELRRLENALDILTNLPPEVRNEIKDQKLKALAGTLWHRGRRKADNTPHPHKQI